MKYITSLLSALFLGLASLFQAQTALDSGLVACYALNGNAYEPIHQLNGSLHHVGLAADQLNLPNSALSFTAKESCVTLPPASLLKPSRISFSAWIRPAQAMGQRIIVNTMTQIGSSAYLLMLDANNRLEVRKGNTAVAAVLTGTSQLAMNAWSHVCFTMDHSSIRLYLNGVLEATLTAGVTFQYVSAYPVYLGNLQPGSPSFFRGLIDNVRFYDRPLSPAEVSLLYTSNPPCETPLLPPVASFTAGPLFCATHSLSLQDLSLHHPDRWQWSVSGTSFSSLEKNPVFIPPAAGNYTVSLICANQLGSDTLQQVITVHPLPPVKVSASHTIMCYNKDTVTLSPSGALHYTCSPPTQTVGQNFLVTSMFTTTYTISGQDLNNCVNTTTILIRSLFCHNWPSTGLAEIPGKDAAHLRLMPNPSRGPVLLDLPETGHYEMYSFSGQLLQSGRGGRQELDLSPFPPGVYLFRLRDGPVSRTVRLIRE
jgi:hypothetical protein